MLFRSPKVQSYEYVANYIFRGAGAMPSFQQYLTDEQVAHIVNYVRQELNAYPESVSAPVVRPLRNATLLSHLEGSF